MTDWMISTALRCSIFSCFELGMLEWRTADRISTLLSLAQQSMMPFGIGMAHILLRPWTLPDTLKRRKSLFVCFGNPICLETLDRTDNRNQEFGKPQLKSMTVRDKHYGRLCITPSFPGIANG